MSDSEEAKPQIAKPSRLSGLIAPKGAAARPNEQSSPQPASAPAPVAPDPIFVAAPAQAGPIGTGSKSLTLRLPDTEYERLRAHAYATRKTHQTILAEALRQYLNTAGAK